MDNRTERLVDGLWRIEVLPYLNVFVVANDGQGDSGGLTLIDTGVRRSGPKIVRSIRALGLDPAATTDVLLTHWHLDHVGSAARFSSSSAAPATWAAAGDLAVVRGQARPRPAADTPRSGRVFLRLARTATAVPDARELAHDARWPVAGGLRAVHTPGHTPGHCAFFLERHGALVAGDAFWNVLRPWRGPRASSWSPAAQRASLARLSELDPQVVAVSHGPPVTRQPRAVLRRLAG